MSGYPNIPARVAYGPQMRNKFEPRIADTDLAADSVNLTFWQIAGAARVLPMALILFDGVTPQILSQALAFDPKQELGDIAFVDNGVGDYTFTFAGTYLNQNGAATPFVPSFSAPFVQGGAAGTKANSFLPSGQDVRVVVRDIAEASIDATFVLAVW